MKALLRLFLGAAGAAASLLGTRPLRAGSTIGLSYAAPDPCPSETLFVAAVAARGGRFEPRDGDASRRRLVVTIRQDGGEFIGTLRVQDVDIASGPREVHATQCADVVDGLAVVTAIALDRDVEKAPVAVTATARTESTAAAPAPGATASSNAALPLAEPASDRRLRSIGQTGKETVPVPAGELTFDNLLAITATAGIAWGSIPSVALPRYDLTGFRAYFVTTPDSRHFLTGIVPRMRLTYYGVGTHRSGEFSTELRGVAASFSACRSVIDNMPGLAVMLCGGIVAGAMFQQTHHAERVTTHSKMTGITASQLDADVRYNFGSLVHVGLVAGAEFWISRLSAERPDGSELFRSSILQGYAMAGLGVHF